MCSVVVNTMRGLIQGDLLIPVGTVAGGNVDVVSRDGMKPMEDEYESWYERTRSRHTLFSWTPWIKEFGDHTTQRTEGCIVPIKG